MRLLFFEIYKRSIYNVAESVALSKHVTHYGPRSVFPYHTMTTPYQRASIGSLSSTRGCTEQLCGFESLESAQVLGT